MGVTLRFILAAANNVCETLSDLQVEGDMGVQSIIEKQKEKVF